MSTTTSETERFIKCDECGKATSLDDDHTSNEEGFWCAPCYSNILSEEMAYALGGYRPAASADSEDVRCGLCGAHEHGTKGCPAYGYGYRS